MLENFDNLLKNWLCVCIHDGLMSSTVLSSVESLGSNLLGTEYPGPILSTDL